MLIGRLVAIRCCDQFLFLFFLFFSFFLPLRFFREKSYFHYKDGEEIPEPLVEAARILQAADA